MALSPPVLRAPLRALLLALALVVVALAAAAPQAHAARRTCPAALIVAGVPTTLVVLRGTTCATAGRVAHAFARDAEVPRWTCATSRAPFDEIAGRDVAFSCGFDAGAGDLRRSRRAFVGTVARTTPGAVIACDVQATNTTVVSSARAMTCAAAARRLQAYRGEIVRSFRPGDGFGCLQQSGGPLSGQWRCTDGRRAFRFEFAD